MNRSFWPLALALLPLLAACGGGGGREECDFDGQTVLADTAWPKLGRDPANTSRIEAVGLGDTPVQRWVFPPLDEDALAPIANAALIGANDQIHLVAATSTTSPPEVRLFVLDADTGQVQNEVTPTPGATPAAEPSAPTLVTGATITGTPLLGADGTVYVATLEDGILRRFETDGDLRTSSVIRGLVSASPNIGMDGTVYIGSGGGAFSAVCPNGIPRFIAATGPVETIAAVAEDGTIVMADTTAQVRAFRLEGFQLWTFSAAAPVRAPVILDESEQAGDGRVIVVDNGGAVFALGLADGRLVWSQQTGAASAVTHSAALGTTLLYVANDAGVLSALSAENGSVQWTCTVPAPIRSVPAVASSAAGESIVFGADDGRLYAIDGAAAATCAPPAGCACEDVALWTFAIGAPVGDASPSIGTDGTVYIGAQDGRLRAIGAGPGE